MFQTTITSHAPTSSVAAPLKPFMAKLFGAQGPSFHTLIDMINPLQHIPLISLAYRHYTGKTIAPVAEVAGGALYGGPVGAAFGFGGALLEQLMESAAPKHPTDTSTIATTGAVPAAVGQAMAQAAEPTSALPPPISSSTYHREPTPFEANPGRRRQDGLTRVHAYSVADLAAIRATRFSAKV